MKRILSAALLITVTVSSFAQSIEKKAVADTAGKYKPANDRVYQFALSGEQIGLLLQSSQAGVIPYLKTIKLSMDKLDEAQQVFATIINGVAYQYRQQFVSDSLRAAKPAIKKQ